MAERVLRAYGLGHMLTDARFATNEARVQHAALLDDAVCEAIAARTLDQNMVLIEAHELTAVPVQTVADIERDPHWIQRGLLVDVADGSTTVRMHDVIPRLSATPGAVHWSGGALGEHNDAVFGEELGLSRAELQRLREEGVI
jgi:succinyl-CoA--D-citramalate CoA-transferase